jgi:hypothetical protein
MYRGYATRRVPAIMYRGYATVRIPAIMYRGYATVRVPAIMYRGYATVRVPRKRGLHSLQGQKLFSSPVSKPAPGPFEPSIRWATGILLLE